MIKPKILYLLDIVMGVLLFYFLMSKNYGIIFSLTCGYCVGSIVTGSIFELLGSKQISTREKNQ